MPMSTITVAGISPTLRILGATQQLNYDQMLSTLQITNSFVPTVLLPSTFYSEFRNNLFSGFRWIHLTNSTDTYGSLTLQNFINAQVASLGNNMIEFNSSGINVFVPINFNSQIITSGTWNGNVITVPYGGTGIASTVAYSVLCGGTTSTGALQSVASVGTAGQVLTSSGAGALPIWAATGTVSSITAGTGLSGGTITTTGTISLITPVSLTNGGTNANLTASNGGIFYSTATAGAILAGTATANQILLSGASGAPSWSTVTYPSTTTINQLLYSSANNVLSGLATANNGVLITSAGGVPSISSTLPTAVQGNITSVGTITSGTWNGNIITVPYGGTGVASTTAYSVLCGGTTSTGALQSVASVGTATQVLTSQGAGALPIWATKAYCSIIMSGNVTATTIVTPGTFVKVAGVTSSSISNVFTATSNRMTYPLGNPSITVLVTVSLSSSHTGAPNATDTFTIFKNGTSISTFVAGISMQPGNGVIFAVSISAIITMNATDFIEVFATSTSAIPITVVDLDFMAIQI